MSRAWDVCVILIAAAFFFLQNVRVMVKGNCKGVVLFCLKGVCTKDDGSAVSLFLKWSCVKHEFNRERDSKLVSRDLKKG